MSLYLNCFICIYLLYITKVASETRNCLVSFDNSSNAKWVQYDDNLQLCVDCNPVFGEHSTNVSILTDIDDFKPCCNDSQLDSSTYKPGCELNSNLLPCEDKTICTDDTNGTKCEFFSCEIAYDNKCLPRTNICDGEKNCDFGEDETNCLWQLGTCTGFLCPFPHRKCLPLDKVCDNVKDCIGGADEHNCPKCPNQFRCEVYMEGEKETAQCFNIRRVCDGVQHCDNNQDELNCFRWSEWSTWSSDCFANDNELRNKTRKCISANGDYSDTANCINYQSDLFSHNFTWIQNCTEELLKAQSTVLSTSTIPNDYTSYSYTTQDSNLKNTSLSSEENTSEESRMSTFYTTRPNKLSKTTSNINESGVLLFGINSSMQLLLLGLAIFFFFVILCCVCWWVREKKKKTGKWSPTVADIATIAMTTKSFATDVFLRDETTKTKTKMSENFTKNSEGRS